MLSPQMLQRIAANKERALTLKRERLAKAAATPSSSEASFSFGVGVASHGGGARGTPSERVGGRGERGAESTLART